jgi:hypothetical protein
VIEPTEEMIVAFRSAHADAVVAGEPPNRAGLAAVLAIVERDCYVKPRSEMPYKGRLIEHVEHHADAAVEGCTFCPADREPEYCGKPIGEGMICGQPRGHGFPPCGFPVGNSGRELAS